MVTAERAFAAGGTIEVREPDIEIGPRWLASGCGQISAELMSR
jgi:hypothetical protein